MSLPTCTITGRVFEQTGIAGQVVLTVRLEATATDPDFGKILPTPQAITPNPDGLVSFVVWPNQRATEPTRYRLTIRQGSITLADWLMDVPDVPEVDLLAVISES